MTGAAKARWLLVFLAWTGGVVGLPGLPWIHSVTAAWIEVGGTRALLARLFSFWIYWLLFRTAWDMATDVSDYLNRGRDNPSESYLPVIDGRLTWSVASVYLWTLIEQVSLLAAAAAFTVLLWRDIEEIAGIDFVRCIGLALAFHSVILRNAAPVFPLPYRWLGLRRYWTDEEGRAWRWPWATRSGLGLIRRSE